MLMFRAGTSNLSWLFAMLCIVYFPTFGTYDEIYAKMDKGYDKESLRGDMLEILGKQSEIKSQTIHEQKKIILNSSMEVKIKNESIENLMKQKYELQKSIFNAKMDLKTKNESVEFLTNENKKLHTFVEKQRRELAQQTKTEKEMESQLIQKEHEICDLETKMKSILMVTESIIIKTEMELFKFSKIHNETLTEKENEICDFKKTQTELELKLIEKEKNACDFTKTQNELESNLIAQKELFELKLIEKENEIRDICEDQKGLLKLELIEKQNEIYDFKKTANELISKFIKKENEIRDFNKFKNKLESNLIGNDVQIDNMSKIEQSKEKEKEKQFKMKTSTLKGLICILLIYLSKFLVHL